MIKKIFCICVVVIMSLGICFGCADKTPLPYNAVIIDSGIVPDKIDMIPQVGRFTDEFWKENTIGGLFYKNKNRNPDDAESEEYIYDKISPQVRIRIIRNQEEFKNIFMNTIEIDFEKEMIVIYMYCSVYTRPVAVKDIKANDTSLTFEYVMAKRKFGYKDASSPQRRFMVVKMDKLDIDNVEFCKI